ncbi:MAG TPA: DinB family protein [Gemmatimonadaceae bacterium]|nr:DinB family protein [Gemmatimonadaceae bacterium]
MHPRLVEVMRFVELKREELLRSIDGLPTGRLGLRASEESWSVAEILEHLRLVENSVVQVITFRAAEARTKGIGPEASTTSVLGAMDHFGIAEGSTPMRVPSIVRPGRDPDVREALAGLEASRGAFRAAVESVDGLALGEIKQVHRALGELDLYQWIVFLGQHEARHTRQIERTLQATGD